MIKTFEELIAIDTLVGSLYTKTPELKETKFGYAYKRFFTKNIEPAINDYKQGLEDIRISQALENKQTGAIVVDPSSFRGYSYSKEGLQGVVLREREFTNTFNHKEIEIIPFISSYIPEGMNNEEYELLLGILI